MKKIIFFLILFCSLSLKSFANESLSVVVPTSTATNNYVLYPTINMYTFLKLDTRNGKIKLVQYAIEDNEDNEFEYVLNDKALVTNGRPGQFVLYPTKNNWTFILLDTINGDTYHVQWSQDDDKRFLYKIRKSY